MDKTALTKFSIIVVVSIIINYTMLKFIGINTSFWSLALWTFLAVVYLEMNLVANKSDKMCFYDKFIVYVSVSALIFCYLLLPYYYGFFTSIAEQVIYFFLVIFLLFISMLIYDGNKVVSIIEKSVPLATLATISLGIVQFYSKDLSLRVSKEALTSSIALASWSGRFLLYGTVLLIIYLILNETINKFDETMIINKKIIVINRIKPIYVSLRIMVPLIFFASIYLLLKSFLVVIKIT